MKKVIIIGGGFAGLSAMEKLSKNRKHLGVFLIDKKDYFCFLPALPDVLSETIPADYLTENLATLCNKNKSVFINEEVVKIDRDEKCVKTNQGSYSYDYIIIASGSETNFYGNDDLKKYAFKLDDVPDAQKIISTIKNGVFKNLVISGGGYTGIETACHLKKLSDKYNLDKKITILEKSPTLLGPLPQWMKDYAVSILKRRKIEFLTNISIDKIQGDKLYLSNKQIISDALLIWTAGVKTGDYVFNINTDKTRQGRLNVDKYLRVSDDCFAAGDASQFLHNGTPIRMAVQFSLAQGNIAAENLIRMQKKLPMKEYKPLDLGYVIPMTERYSCGNIFGVNLKGRLPLAMHYAMCIYRSRSLKNKLGFLKNLI